MKYEVFSIAWDLDYDVDDWEVGLPAFFFVDIPSNGQDGDRLSSPIQIEKYIEKYALDKFGYEIFQMEFQPVINKS